MARADMALVAKTRSTCFYCFVSFYFVLFSLLTPIHTHILLLLYRLLQQQDLGMSTDGGFGEYIRVPTKWIVTPNPFMTPSTSAVPCALSAARVAMVYGTAGLTAALSVQKLLDAGKAKPSNGKVIVTGATGSVGSVAVELLATLGFDVVAISGKAGSPQGDALIELLGASEVLVSEYSIVRYSAVVIY